MWGSLPLLMALMVGAPGGPGAPTAFPGAGQPVVCAGGDSLAPLARVWAEATRHRDPTLAVVVDTSARLAADGFAELLDGRAQCVLFVREPFPSEESAFRARFGREPLLIPVAGGSFATKGGTHAIAIYVNAANPIRGLTLQQLDAVFSADRRRGGAPAETWGDLGLTGAWASHPIHRYGMLTKRDSGDPPGVVNFIQRRVLKGGRFRDDIAQQVDQPGEQALAAIVRKVGEDPDGIGYSGFGYAAGPVRPAPLIEATGGFVEGTPATVADRTYPLSRRIYVMIDRGAGRPIDPALRAFLLQALSPEGQAALAADKAGFLPLSASDAAAARALVE